MTRAQLIDVALAFDAEPIEVRRDVATWLALHGDYGAGCAAGLLRREPRQCVNHASREVA